MELKKVIMYLTMNTGQRFSFYVESEEVFTEIENNIKTGDPEKFIECIPTLSIKPKFIAAIEKFYEEAKG